MIGTHDSYTFLRASNPVMEWLSFLWRTQDKSIEEQKGLGVGYFDIRVRHDRKRNCWRVCHGLVDFDQCFQSVEKILNAYSVHKVRLILERGKAYDESIFRYSVSRVCDYPCLSFAAIKKDWKVLVDKDPKITDYSYVPFLSSLSFWENVKRMKWLDTIRHYAKRHRPKITEEMRKEEAVHFMDFV